MEHLSSIIQYILGFKVYVLLPVIIFIFAMVFRIKFATSIKSAISIGTGFIGIFITFDFFVANIGPAVKALVSRTGLQMNVLDVGWPPLATVAWGFKLAPLMILVILLVNVILLFTRRTKVVNVDIWNFWHFLMVGALVYSATHSVILTTAAIITAEVIVLKIAEWGAPHVKSYTGISGISITTLSVGAYYPAGVIGNAIIEKIPGLRSLKADPVSLRNRLGIAGDPMIIGAVLGIALGIGAAFDVKKTLELAVAIAAVIILLPAMCGILSSGLIPISDGMKHFMQKKFPHFGETYIGLDNAVIMGDPAMIVSGLLLMPVALALAFILPGVTFIPIGDLPNLMAFVIMIVVATRGNVVRTVLIGIPLIVAQLYIASYMGPVFTDLAQKSNVTFGGYDGPITSFFDGGLPWRFWFYKVFSGNVIALAFIPLVAVILYATWRLTREKEKKDVCVFVTPKPKRRKIRAK